MVPTIDPIHLQGGGAVIVGVDSDDVVHLHVGGVDVELTRDEARAIASRLKFIANMEGSCGKSTRDDPEAN